jgi:hypothetical protein
VFLQFLLKLSGCADAETIRRILDSVERLVECALEAGYLLRLVQVELRREMGAQVGEKGSADRREGGELGVAVFVRVVGREGCGGRVCGGWAGKQGLEGGWEQGRQDDCEVGVQLCVDCGGDDLRVQVFGAMRGELLGDGGFDCLGVRVGRRPRGEAL